MNRAGSQWTARVFDDASGTSTSQNVPLEPGLFADSAECDVEVSVGESRRVEMTVFDDFEGERVSFLPVTAVADYPEGTPCCGDETRDAEFEECDDGNEIDGDGCDSSCMCEAGSSLLDCPVRIDDFEQGEFFDRPAVQLRVR